MLGPFGAIDLWTWCRAVQSLQCRILRLRLSSLVFGRDAKASSKEEEEEFNRFRFSHKAMLHASKTRHLRVPRTAPPSK